MSVHTAGMCAGLVCGAQVPPEIVVGARVGGLGCPGEGAGGGPGVGRVGLPQGGRTSGFGAGIMAAMLLGRWQLGGLLMGCTCHTIPDCWHHMLPSISDLSPTGVERLKLLGCGSTALH